MVRCKSRMCVDHSFTHLSSYHSFVADNWNSGWMGKFMWRVLRIHLGLKNQDIQAMTSINFTGATDPKNATSVYKGPSSFTRCVWEVHLGNVVSGYILLHAVLRSAGLSKPSSRTCASGISGRLRSADRLPPSQQPSMSTDSCSSQRSCPNRAQIPLNFLAYSPSTGRRREHAKARD